METKKETDKKQLKPSKSQLNNSLKEKVIKKVKKDSKTTKIQKLEKLNEELKNDYLRTRADFDNYRKRKEKEIIQAREKGMINFVLDLLPAIDNFEMSLKMTDNKEMFIKGVEMIHKNMLDTLKENKVEDFSPKTTDKFDPYLHDPILIEDQTKTPGEIITILKKGYKFKDTIIRPARVQIVKENKN